MHCESKQSKELLEWEAKVRGYMQILQKRVKTVNERALELCSSAR